MNTFNINRKPKILAGFLQKLAWSLVLLSGFFYQSAFAQLDITLSVTEPSCNGYLDASIATEMNGGEAPYVFAWSNGMTTHELYGIGAGDFSVTVTDANGEEGTATVTVPEPDILAPYIEYVTDICEGVNGSLQVVATGGTAPYTYSWSNGADTDNISDLNEGQVVVTVTDANGCIGVTSTIINQPFSIEVRTIDVICAAFCDGSAEAVLTGGTAPYTIIWSNGGSTEVIDLLEPGDYSVTVVDGNGCTVEAMGTVGEPPALIVEVNVEGTCEDGDDITAKASASGGIPPYTFRWNNGVVGETNSNITRGTTYFVTVTDANGCNEDKIVPIPLLPGLVVSTGIENPGCDGDEGGTAMAVATGGTPPYTYEWSNGISGDTITSLVAGPYSVTATDAEGCQGEASVQIADGNQLTLNTSMVNADCDGVENGMANVAPQGGIAPYSILWSDGQTTNTAMNLAPGNYSVTVTDAQNCMGIEMVSVGVDAGIDLSVSATNTSCPETADGSITITPSGGTAPYSFAWESGQTGATLNNLAPGTYNVVVTDANNCRAEIMGIVAEPEVIAIELNVEGTCDEGSEIVAEAEATGGVPPYTFTWSNGDIGASTNNIVRGETYMVTVTDANQCDQEDLVTIPSLPGLVLSVQGENPDCDSDDGGTAMATPSSGTPPYTFMWSNGETGNSISDLEAGSYTVTATDAEGCEGEASVQITEGNLTVVVNGIGNASCPGMQNGSASVTVEGGVGPYTYVWNNGQTGDMLVNLAAGPYVVTVTDSQNCMGTEMVTVGTDNVIDLMVETINATCEEAADGSITITPSGGTAPYTIEWGGGQTSETLNDLSPGQYTVFVTDANNCETSETITVEEDSGLQANFNFEITSCDSNNIVTIAFTSMTSSATGWEWDIDDEIFTIPNPVITATQGSEVLVKLTITTADSCTATNIDVVEPELFDFEVSPAVMPCIGDDATLSVTNNSMDSLTYQWTPADIFVSGTDTPNPVLNTEEMVETTAMVLITHPLGCTISETVDITVIDEIVPNPEAIMTEQCEGTMVEFSHDIEEVQYVWDFGDPDNPNATSQSQDTTYTYMEAGTYTVTLSPVDESSCAQPVSLELEVVEPPMVDFEAVFDTCSVDGVVSFENQSNIPDSLITSIEWDFSNGETSTVSNPDITLEDSETITAMLTIAYGENCELSTEQEIDVNVMPSIEIEDKFSCQEEAVELNPDPDMTYTYQWSPVNGFEPTDPNPEVMLTESTTYTVTVTDATGNCETVTEVTVDIAPPIEFEALEDVSQCDTTSVTLTTDSEQAVIIEWYSDPDLTNLVGTGNTFDYTPHVRDTTFYINYIDAFDCSVTDEVSIFNYTPSIEVLPPAPLCIGGSTGLEVNNLMAEDELTYDWMPAESLDDPTSDSPTANPTETTTYSVIATNQFGCFVEASTTLEVIDLENELTLTAEPDTILNNGIDQSQLTATEDEGYTYTWTNTETLSQDDIFNPVAMPTDDITYTVTIEDENGCMAEETVEVTVRQSNCVDPFIFVPNAFTPNGDGENDVLFVRGYSITGLYFIIYNRWGEKVFETRDIARGWDGTFKGKAPCSDVYGYYLEVDCFGGERFVKKGNVTILK